jgi:O-succinylbenzoic acid--CoA ligase
VLNMNTTALDSARPPSDWLAQAASQWPDAPALVVEDDTLDYTTLHLRTAQLCQILRSCGVEGGATLAVESRCASLLLFLLHAALAAGFVLFPLDPRLPKRQRTRLVELARADLVLSEDELVRLVQLAEASTSTSPLHDSERPQPVAAEGSQPVLDRPRLLIATSGSGGSPKLVGLSDANLLASVRAANQRLRLSKTSVWLDCLPLVHIGGLSIPLRCVLAGACVVLPEGFHAPGVLDQLHRHQVSHVSLVPAMLARLLELDGRPPRDLRVVLVGGAPLSASLAGEALAAGWPLWVTYGMTETASMLTARKLAAPDDNPQQVGRPLPGFELRLVDEQGEPTSAAGVIQVSGAAVCDGGDPSAERWFSTGDRGQMDEAGRLTLLGRADSMLISGGEKVYPELVEEQLAGFPGIDEVAVSGRADPVWGERLVAVYRGDIDEAALAQLCRDGIAGAMRPRAFVKVDNLPRTANGKLDRGALRDLVAQL